MLKGQNEFRNYVNKCLMDKVPIKYPLSTQFNFNNINTEITHKIFSDVFMADCYNIIPAKIKDYYFNNNLFDKMPDVMKIRMFKNNINCINIFSLDSLSDLVVTIYFKTLIDGGFNINKHSINNYLFEYLKNKYNTSTENNITVNNKMDLYYYISMNPFNVLEFSNCNLFNENYNMMIELACISNPLVILFLSDNEIIYDSSLNYMLDSVISSYRNFPSLYYKYLYEVSYIDYIGYDKTMMFIRNGINPTMLNCIHENEFMDIKEVLKHARNMENEEDIYFIEYIISLEQE